MNELIQKYATRLAISNAPTPKLSMMTKTVATAKVDDIIRVAIDFILIGVMARASSRAIEEATRRATY